MADPVTTIDPATGTVFTKVAEPTAPAAPVDDTTVGVVTGTKSAAQALPTADSLLADAKPADPVVEPTKDPEAPVALKAEDYKVTLPEGLAADDPLLTSFLEGSAKAGLDNEKVNAIVAELAPKVAEQLAAPHKAWVDLQKSWQSEVKADSEIGGSNLDATVARINQGIARFGDADAVALALRTTGAGNNPAIIKLLNNMSKALGEGTLVQGQPAPEGKSAGATLYTHPTSQPARV